MLRGMKTTRLGWLVRHAGSRNMPHPSLTATAPQSACPACPWRHVQKNPPAYRDRWSLRAGGWWCTVQCCCAVVVVAVVVDSQRGGRVNTAAAAAAAGCMAGQLHVPTATVIAICDCDCIISCGFARSGLSKFFRPLFFSCFCCLSCVSLCMCVTSNLFAAVGVVWCVSMPCRERSLPLHCPPLRGRRTSGCLEQGRSDS